jgi:hypothetical protein
VFKFMSGLSLLLCVATIALWVRSYHVHDEAVHARVGGTYTEIYSGMGRMTIERTDGCPYDLVHWQRSRGGPSSVWIDTLAAPDGREWVKPMFDESGYLIASGPWFIPTGPRSVTWIRYWLVVLLAALLPVVHAVPFVFNRWRARRFAREGRCPHCGYDLRATPDRCPECGRPAATFETVQSPLAR